ncbi:MAG: hypothetical protein ABIQ35_13635, partial [Verrucomicrobiota bacterium]
VTIFVRGNLLKPGAPVVFEVAGSPANSQRWFGIYLPNENRSELGPSTPRLGLHNGSPPRADASANHCCLAR